MTMERFPVGRDAIERIGSTFVQALLALATADGIGWIDWANLSNWKAWGAAALAAAFSTVKVVIATQIAKRRGSATSASLDPAVQLQPTAAVHD